MQRVLVHGKHFGAIERYFESCGLYQIRLDEPQMKNGVPYQVALFSKDDISHLTLPAPDKGDSPAPEKSTAPEGDTASGNEPTPAPRG